MKESSDRTCWSRGNFSLSLSRSLARARFLSKVFGFPSLSLLFFTPLWIRCAFTDKSCLLFSNFGIRARGERKLMASGSGVVDLADVPSVDLMTELLRRMKCASKPDRRLIFIGISLRIPHFYRLIFQMVLLLELWLPYAWISGWLAWV